MAWYPVPGNRVERRHIAGHRRRRDLRCLVGQQRNAPRQISRIAAPRGRKRCRQPGQTTARGTMHATAICAEWSSDDRPNGSHPPPVIVVRHFCHVICLIADPPMVRSISSPPMGS